MRRLVAVCSLLGVGACGAGGYAAPGEGGRYAIGDLMCVEPRGINQSLLIDGTAVGESSPEEAVAVWIAHEGASLDPGSLEPLGRAIDGVATFVHEGSGWRVAELTAEDTGKGWFMTGFKICHEERMLVGIE